MNNLNTIASQFLIEGTVNTIRPLGNGLINDTYRVATAEDGKPDYVLQRINHNIFTDVELLQHNIETVTDHIREQLRVEGVADLDRRVLRFVPTAEGKTYWHDGENYWRVSVFIADAVTMEAVTPVSSYDAGRAFGDFEARLADIAGLLGETIPDFHNMYLRRDQLREVYGADPVQRAATVKDFVAEIEAYMDEMCLGERLLAEGKLQKRVCHCDTKVNNMMLDKDGKVLCVIDLDTVMPSLFVSDYGDFLRTAANTVAEDSPEFDKIDFRMDIFEAFTRGYLETASRFLTPLEVSLLPYAAELFPYMQCVRFLWDYLSGDHYWKCQYADHNLTRARNQWHLFLKAKEHEAEMKQFICGL
ncbi:MAG: aminoglycoside phosphotransferase family protein [Prevotella sp.]|nr:aminoglycoside phosphotransferase family protein [Prevotella sp.]